MGMRVWIDHSECTGDGLCEETCSTAFTLLDDGLAYVREDARYFGETRVLRPLDDAGGQTAQGRVPDEWVDAALEAAEMCPGECIFIETD